MLKYLEDLLLWIETISLLKIYFIFVATLALIALSVNALLIILNPSAHHPTTHFHYVYQKDQHESQKH